MFDTGTVIPVQNDGWDPRVRAFRCGNTVDTFAVITERYLVLVDTMVGSESMATLMDLLAGERTASRPLLAVNTHGDWDHVWGNGLFAAPDARYPAPIVGSRRTAEIMSSADAPGLLASMQEEYPGQFDSAAWWPPTVCFEGELRIAGGDLTLELIPTPGHTPDHHAVWIPEIRLLLAGDAAEMPLPFVSNAASLPVLRASLRQLDDLHATTVLYCHAPGVSDPALIHHNIAYFDQLERRCRDALSHGPLDPTALTNPARAINWPLEDALPSGITMADLSMPDFYRQGHDEAIQAMLEWLQSSDATPRSGS